jgi:hypothetical protein
VTKYPHLVIACAAALFAALPARAQETSLPAPSQECELHVWPTANYRSFSAGLLAGLGPLGAVADAEAHKDQVKTIVDLMRDYLGPDAQIEELNKAGLVKALKLDGYRVIVEERHPLPEEIKKDPKVQERANAINARLKSGDRLTSSTASCYAELIGAQIFYHRAPMYGSNLFAEWVYREFPATGKVTRTTDGMVKNPLENFPPKAEDKVEAAKLELRDAYAKDFAEYVAKKVKPPRK